MFYLICSDDYWFHELEWLIDIIEYFFDQYALYDGSYVWKKGEVVAVHAMKVHGGVAV
jgi:hypothetical protein